MKRKLLTLTLATIMSSGSIVPVSANPLESPNNDLSNIETLIGFRYPETKESLKNKNLKATLIGEDSTIEIDFKNLIENQTYENITSEVMEEEGKIKSIKFKIDNLKPYKNYKLTIDGDKYLKTDINLDTTEFSKRIDINTGASLMLGDANDDEVIDSEDIKVLEDNLNSESTEFDLNGDGKITVADIAIVNKNMKEVITASVYDTNAIPSAIIEKVDISEMASGSQIQNGGAIEDIFKPEGELKLAPAAEQETVSLPITFNQPEEISEFSISLPDGTPEENVAIKFFDETGDEIQIPEQPIRAYSINERQAGTVVTVNLGKRVAVKKIKVDVKPKDDGFVVVKEVTFLKDVVDDSILEDTKVKNVKATALDKQVALSWRAVPNVTGYKISYGTDRNNLNNSTTSSSTSTTIGGLENLTEYYFQISGTSGDWEGEKSEIISATPIPKVPPKKPDFLVATPKDSKIELSWKASEGAEWYEVYTKRETDASPILAVSDVRDTSATINGLENGVNYSLYVKAYNTAGASDFSDHVDATPVKELIEIPKIPTKNKLDNLELVEKIEMGHPHNYDQSLYPDGFDPNWLIDGNYETSWVARRWGEANYFEFTFKTPQTMDYLVWVPRLDKNFRKSFDRYNIEVWTEGMDLKGQPTSIARDKKITIRGEDNKYFVFKFPKTENIKKIRIKPIQWDGSPTNMSASEVAFYSYNDIADRINNLFANNIKTQIKPEVTLEQIAALELEVNDTEGFVYDREILTDLLDLAKKLKQNDNSALGIIKEGIESRNGSKDTEKFGKSINGWQPLGLVAKPGETIRIYAEIPEGETVSLVATQFFEKPHAFESSPIKLSNGENYIKIPQLGTVVGDRGGALYLQYSGEKQQQIKLHVRGGHKIPYLEINDLHTISEEDAKNRIGNYIDELLAYNPNGLGGNLEWNVLNSTEISLPDVLLSVPATQVLKGISANGNSREQRINTLYNSVLAWEDLIDIVYKTYGIDEHKTNGFETRQNIRYMKMFTGAFMYASGNHIGVGFNSVAPLFNGKPLKLLEENATSNNIFGWGIAHEIGHVMDSLGKAEITNNIYSLMGQTADGKANTLKSRLELNNVYEKIYKKVSIGKEGLPNDLFVHLGMYWQLHLAYDDAQNPTRFYNELHKLYRSGELNNFTDMNKFAVASSKVANKNLTEFFTRWGVALSEEAKIAMAQYENEERAIYYLNDESRRQRLANNPIGNINVTANASVSQNEDNDQLVTINIQTEENSKNIIGYEIIRNGKTIGFTTTNQFVDKIDSANNMTFNYKVKPINILGQISPEVSAGEIRISYDNVVSSELYDIDASSNIITFKEPTIISGIKITPKNDEELPTGTYKVEAELAIIDGEESAPAPANIVSENPTERFIAIKNGDFSKNDTQAQKTYLSYFNRTAQEDDKIWTYEVNKVKLTGIDLTKYNVQFISYPGDNIEFLDLGIGKLESAFEDIPVGSLVIMGKYRGNTATNDIIIKGKFARESGLNETTSEPIERAINGDIYMLDTVDENGKITSSTKEGIFIFYPNIQKESEIQGDSCSKTSILPSEIKAEFYKNDSHGQRLTSDTLWTPMPDFDSLPIIRLEGGIQE